MESVQDFLCVHVHASPRSPFPPFCIRFVSPEYEENGGSEMSKKKFAMQDAAI